MSVETNAVCLVYFMSVAWCGWRIARVVVDDAGRGVLMIEYRESYDQLYACCSREARVHLK